MLYEPRVYRQLMNAKGTETFSVVVKETDLHIQLAAKQDSRERRFFEKLSLDKVIALRSELEDYIGRHEGFAASLNPVAVADCAPEIVRRLAEAGGKWNVGPMAAVAGTFAQMVAETLLPYAKMVIVENGGDIYVVSDKPVVVGLYAGDASPFTGKINIKVPASPNGIGICTSSGTVGHSLSFGNADAVVAIASSGSMADAAATSIANRVVDECAVDILTEEARDSQALSALVIAIRNKIGFWGDIEISK